MLLITFSAHAQQGYSSLCVCVCVCVTTLGVSPFVYRPKTRYHRLHYDDFLKLDFGTRISLKRPCSRDMALYAYHGEP